MIIEEWEPKKAEEDMIVENAEITCGNILIQKVQIMNMGSVNLRIASIITANK